MANLSTVAISIEGGRRYISSSTTETGMPRSFEFFLLNSHALSRISTIYQGATDIRCESPHLDISGLYDLGPAPRACGYLMRRAGQLPPAGSYGKDGFVRFFRGIGCDLATDPQADGEGRRLPISLDSSRRMTSMAHISVDARWNCCRVNSRKSVSHDYGQPAAGVAPSEIPL
jgi:hypothetical protein